MVKSLFNKLLASHLLVILITLIVLGVFVTFLFSEYYHSAQEEELKDRGVKIARTMSEYMEQGKPVSEVLSAVSGLVDGQAFWVQRQALVMSRRGMHGRFHQLQMDPSDAEKLLQGEVLTQKGYMPRFEKEMVIAVVPVEYDDSVAGVLILSRPLADIANTVDAVRRLTLFAAVPAVFMAFIFAYFMSRSISRPLREMSSATRAMAAGDFRQRVQVSSGDEMGELAKDFNNLAGTLDNTINALSREKEKTENILDNMADGVVAVNKEGRIISINGRALEYLNLDNNIDLQERKLNQISVPTQLEELFEEVLNTGSTGSTEITAVTGSSKEITVLIHASPLWEDNREKNGEAIFGAVGVLHDISELRRLEQMRRELVANVSHELRTPLTSIQGFVEAMMDGTIEDGEARKKYLDIIYRETNRLNRLIRNLLDLAALESGEAGWEVHRVDLVQVINRVLAKLEPQVEEKEISFEKHIPEDLPLLYVNEDRTEQVLTNILDNAVHFSPRGGVIMIETRSGENEVKVSVGDRGPGIPEDKLDYIWERFHRVDKSRSRARGGTGLGLAIARQIVEAHGGRVEVQNRPGGGALFSFTLPLMSVENRNNVE